MAHADLPAVLGLALCALAPATSRGGEPSASVVLRWEAVPDAVAYEVEVARDRDFADAVVAERTQVPGYRWRAIPAERHYWRVRSLDANGRAGPWSETKVIESALTAPAPAEPPDGARLTWDRDDRAVAFSGTPSELLREYRLEVAADPDFSKPVVSRRGPSPAFRVGLPGLGTFHWRLGGVALDGREAPWSPPRRLTVALGAPRLSAPEPGGSFPFGPVTVAWEPLQPAATYRVVVETGDGPPRQMAATAPPLVYAPHRPGRHRVRVAAVLPDGRTGPASEDREFRIAPPAPLPAPRLTEPAAGAILDEASRPGFAWETVPGAAGYELQAAPPGALDRAPTQRTEGARLEVGGLPRGSLAWRVRARDAFGGPGTWSEARGLHLGPRPAARIEIRLEKAALVADGSSSTQVTIRLLDAEGRAVPGSPSVETSAGRVEGLSRAGDGWVARYVAPPLPPPGGAAEIDVRERDLSGQTRIGLSREVDRLALGVLAGWRTNLKAVSSPTLGVEMQWRTPLLDDRLILSARASWYQESATIPPTGGLAAPMTSTARVVPLTVLAIYEWPLGWATLHAGAGLGADLTWVEVGPAYQLAATPAAAAALGASRALGPGEALLELAASAGSLDTSLASMRTGGLTLSLGYRLRP